MTKKVFLGGTASNSTWRTELIDKLDSTKISYFNPVVEDWNEEVQQEELHQRATCDFLLYVITQEMLGFYAIAEVVDDSNKRPDKTIFCYLEEGFGEHQVKSLHATAKLIKENGAQVFTSLAEVAEWLNNQQIEEQTIISENVNSEQNLLNSERQCNPMSMARQCFNYLCGKKENQSTAELQVAVELSPPRDS